MSHYADSGTTVFSCFACDEMLLWNQLITAVRLKPTSGCFLAPAPCRWYFEMLIIVSVSSASQALLQLANTPSMINMRCDAMQGCNHPRTAVVEAQIRFAGQPSVAQGPGRPAWPGVFQPTESRGHENPGSLASLESKNKHNRHAAALTRRTRQACSPRNASFIDSANRTKGL